MRNAIKDPQCSELTSSAMIDELRSQLALYEAENKALRAKLDLFEQHPTLAKGIKGEHIIVTLLGGLPSSRNASHDIKIKDSGILIEVKYANHHLAVPNSATRLWTWAKIFGEAGKKKYDRLILIGDSDPRYTRGYIEPESPYVFFDVGYSEAVHLTIKTGRFYSIALTTNPVKAKSVAAPLFKHYQVTLAELGERYGL